MLLNMLPQVYKAIRSDDLKLTLCIDLKKDEVERNEAINKKEILLAKNKCDIVSRVVEFDKLVIVYENNMSVEETIANRNCTEKESVTQDMKVFFAVLSFCIFLTVVVSILIRLFD